MADRTVRITLTVDSKGAVQAVGATEDELMDLRKTVDHMERDLQGLEKAFQAGLIDASENAQAETRVLEKALKQMLKQGVDPTSEGFQRYKRRLDEMKLGLDDASVNTAPRATNAIMNLNRVISDAPFGFIAVSNNIDPLVDSFQRLSAESGGTRGAIQAMLRSLTGPAGIAFAISSVTALAVALGPKLMEAFGDGSAAADELRRKAQELFDTIVTFESGFKGVRITPENIDEIIRQTEAEIQMLKEFRALGTAGNVSDERIQNEEDILERLEKQKEAFEEQERIMESLIRRGAERVTDEKGDSEFIFSFSADPSEFEALREMLGITQQIAENEAEIAARKMETVKAMQEAHKARSKEIQQIGEKAALDLESNEQEIQATIRQMELERQRQEQMQRAVELSAQNAFIQAQGAEDVAAAVRQQIKAVIAHYVAEAIGKALVGVPFPFNMAAAAVAGTAAGALFNQLIPSFRSGVTNFGGGLAQVHQDEIIALPRGSSVISQVDSRAIMAGARSGAMSGVNRMEAAVMRFDRTVKALQSQGIPAHFNRTAHNTAVREASFHSELTRTSR